MQSYTSVMRLFEGCIDTTAHERIRSIRLIPHVPKLSSKTRGLHDDIAMVKSQPELLEPHETEVAQGRTEHKVVVRWIGRLILVGRVLSKRSNECQ